MAKLTLIFAGLAFAVALLSFLASVTSLFKHTIPVEFGFLFDNKIVQDLDVKTGDPAKNISLRFHNSAKSPLTGVILDVRVRQPLALSGTSEALSFSTLNLLPEQIKHGRTPDFYLIRLSEVNMIGDQNLDFGMELNTQGIRPGTYKIDVLISSLKQNYKDKKAELSVKIS